MSKRKIICVVSGAFVTIGLLFIICPVIKISHYSKKTADILLPDGICYFFGQLDFSHFKEYDNIEVMSSDKNGEKFLSVRTYFENSVTNEKITKVERKDTGCFVKGFYISKSCSCTYYDDGTMKLSGKNIGKVYVFHNGKCKYLYETETCKMDSFKIYVTTYFDSNGKRIAVETKIAGLLKEKKIKTLIYNRRFTASFFPIGQERFEKILA